MARKSTAKAREARDQKLSDLHEELAQGVADLTTSKAWREFLDTAAKFHNYSANNVLLIQLQRPDATRVAGYKDWKKKFNRQVRGGEKAISILAPCVYRKTPEPTDEEPNPKPGPRRIYGYRAVGVFDVSQTDGDPLPDLDVEPLHGEAPANVWDRLVTYLNGEGWTVERGDTAPASGFTRPHDHVIRISDKDDDAEAFSTLVHEAAHAALHIDTDETYVAHRGRMEVEAESVAYIVLKALNVDSAKSSFAYVAGWATKAKPEVIAQTAQTVVTTARDLLAVVEVEAKADTKEKVPA